jgi:hypothetical protein
MQVVEGENGPFITCVGSGTLVSADGLILTNAHVVATPNSLCRADSIVVALTLRLDQPPVPTYLAELLNFNAGLDLAVLRIRRFLDGRLVEAEALRLPFVELGDSNLVNIDDTLTLVAYPDFGESSVQTFSGTVSGFTAEARIGNRAWIRTNAPIPGLASGAGAYNRDGKLVGIPTIAPAVIGDSVVDCRVLQDSNGDGQVNRDDQCIPFGGTISALRPSRLARGLVRAAALGIRLGEDFAPANLPPPTNPPLLRRPFITTGVNAAGQAINVVTRLPSGATSFYLFFDYDNMQNGLTYELRTTIDGRPNATFSLPPVTWNGGQRGLWYIGSAGIPLPNGLYEFTLYVSGRQAAATSLVVGGAPQQSPAFSDLAFGLQDNQGALVGANFIIPETNIVRAQFNYRNIPLGTPWTQVWYLENTELARIPLTWTAGENGVSTEPAIQSEAGLVSGRYRLELYLGEALALTSDFVIAGGAEGVEAAIFSNFQFAAAQIGGQPQAPFGPTFAKRTEQIHVFFDWRQLSFGTPWTWRWSVDNEVIFQADTQWATAPNGAGYYIGLRGEPFLPDGTYRFEIELGGIIAAQHEARIGLGQLPLEAFASAEGVIMTARIIDAKTQQGIPGALFVLLLPEFSVSDFLWDSAQILSANIADNTGRVYIPELLPRGTRQEPIQYSFLVRAEGYLPMSADGVAVTEVTASPLELTIFLVED